MGDSNPIGAERRENRSGYAVLTLALLGILYVASSGNDAEERAQDPAPPTCPACCPAMCVDGLPRRVVDGVCCACPVDPAHLHEAAVPVGSLAPGWNTYRLAVSLPAAYADVEWMGNKGTGVRLQVPPAYHAPYPFGVDVGGVSPAFFAVINDLSNPDMGIAEMDSWLTVGVTDSSAAGVLAALTVDGAVWPIYWTESHGLNVSDSYIEFYGNNTPYPNDGSPVVLAQMTVTDEVAACGTASASVGGTTTDGAPWTESVVWSW